MSALKEEAAKILKAEIKKNGLKQTFIADEIGITRNYLSAMLSRKKKLNTDIALRICKLIGVDAKKILK